MANQAQVEADRQAVIDEITANGGSMEYLDLYNNLNASGNGMATAQIRPMRDAGLIEMQLKTRSDGTFSHRVGLPGTVKGQPLP